MYVCMYVCRNNTHDRFSWFAILVDTFWTAFFGSDHDDRNAAGEFLGLRRCFVKNNTVAGGTCLCLQNRDCQSLLTQWLWTLDNNLPNVTRALCTSDAQYAACKRAPFTVLLYCPNDGQTGLLENVKPYWSIRSTTREKEQLDPKSKK